MVFPFFNQLHDITDIPKALRHAGGRGMRTAELIRAKLYPIADHVRLALLALGFPRCRYTLHNDGAEISMGRPDHPDTLKIQEYRAKAVDALERAALAKDSTTRSSWEFIGTSYHDMAERLERNSKP
jgi:hypothetical protein